MALALLFAIDCFLNLGKLHTTILGLTVDREALYGLLFLAFVPGLPLMYRALNGVQNRLVQFFRLFYPQALYLLFFQQAIVLSQLFYNGRSFDAIFARADRLIFGFEPSIRFHQVFTGDAIVNEVFFFAYFCFFVMMTTGWWVLFAKRRMTEAVRAFSIVTLSFYILYLFYPLFPVEGPKYYFPSLHQAGYEHFKGYLFTDILRYLFDHMNLAGAAFPSSHVAISTLSLLLNLRYNRRLGLVFLPITIVLYFSTVYLYEHYAVDGMAGLIVAVLFCFAVPRLLDAMKRVFQRCDAAIARIYRLPPLAVYAESDETAVN